MEICHRYKSSWCEDSAKGRQEISIVFGNTTRNSSVKRAAMFTRNSSVKRAAMFAYDVFVTRPATGEIIDTYMTDTYRHDTAHVTASSDNYNVAVNCVARL